MQNIRIQKIRKLLTIASKDTVVLPVLTASVMLCIVFVIWHLVATEQLAKLNVDSKSNAEHVAIRLHAHIETRLGVAEHIIDEWVEGNILDQDEFSNQTKSIHDLFSDFQAINWVNPQGIISWVTPFEENKAAQGLNLRLLPVPGIILEKAERTGQIQVSPPIKLAQGGDGFVAYIPIIQSGSNEGFLNLVFRTTPLVTGALQKDISETYHLTIKDEERIVYDSNSMSDNHQYKVTVPVSVGNRTWRLSVMPTPYQIDKSSTIVDEVILIVGLLVTLITAYLIHVIMIRQTSLHESEKRFVKIFESNPTAMALARLEDGLHFNVNEMWLSMMGFTRDEVIGKTVAELGIYKNIEDRTVLMDQLQKYGSLRNHVAVFLTKDGEEINIQYSAEIINFAGVDYNLLSFHNISKLQKIELALRESKARLNAIFDNAPVEIYLKDVEGRYVQINRHFEKLFNVKNEDLLGKFPADAHDPELSKLTRAHDLEVLKTGKAITREVQAMTELGNRVLHTIKFPIFNEDNKITGLGAVVSDITEHIAIEEQLRHSQRIEAVGQLTGGVAHDFNNLMAVMMGNLELAMGKVKPDTPLGNNIEKALEALDQGAALTQHLLSFSRQQNLSPGVTNVKQLVDGTLTFLERTLGENTKIVTNHDSENAFVKIDTHVFCNALINIALNARDAMPDGGILTVHSATVELAGETIGLDTVPAFGPHALITVADTGIGISQGDLKQVMEPFFTTKEVGKGSGLGLSMVYGFVTQSNGHLKITSKEGEGTIISIYLPIFDEERVDIDHETTHITNVNTSKTILFVEDDPQVRATTAATIKEVGYNIIEAEDGVSALKILNLRSNDIDLVLSDVIMPNNVSGIDLAKQIGADYKHIKVILSSGYPDRIADENEIKALGIELLAKPFRREQLAQAIERAVSV